jgi:3,4-dihydroxy-2-butanone 4-phosphate synthase
MKKLLVIILPSVARDFKSSSLIIIRICIRHVNTLIESVRGLLRVSCKVENSNLMNLNFIVKHVSNFTTYNALQ